MRILARAHQQLIWDRVRQTNRLRNALREYFPGALEAFPSLAHGDAVGVLARAPGPREAARLSSTQIRAALRRGGRQRGIEQRAAAVRAALRSPQLGAPPAVSRAFAASTRAAVAQISEINRQIKELEAELAAYFEQHPDAEIYRSLPGLGVVLGARVLGEFGDDPERYESAKSRRNYAATSPLTVASGRKRPRQAPRRLPARLPAPATTRPPPGRTGTTASSSPLDVLAPWGVSPARREGAGPPSKREFCKGLLRESAGMRAARPRRQANGPPSSSCGGPLRVRDVPVGASASPPGGAGPAAPAARPAAR